MSPGTSIFSSKRYKTIVVFVVTVVMILSLVIINPISELNYILEPAISWEFFTDLIWFLILGWAITETAVYVSYFLDKVLPWEQSSLKRFFLQLLVQSMLVMIVMTLLLIITDLLIDTDSKDSDVDWMGYRQMIFVSIVLSLIITAIHTGSHLLLNWKKSIIEAAELKQNTLQSQLQSLKLQLDPHFMFNNFSTLSSLISENPAGAQEFLDALSEVHRYMLYNLDKNIISLQEELDFIASYIYLIKIRFSENLNIDISDMDGFLDKGIPPTTLQLLIENAVKHNIASRSQPLHIKIYQENNYILVVNNIQKMPSAISSSKIGLKNIINRYKLLSSKAPEIVETQFDFVVKVPLLPLNHF
jgi:two-component system LytT family sensor kinase